MQFLKTLFWVVLAILLVVFSAGNWTMVTINLWGGLQADVRLPVLVVFALLAGFLPTFAYYRARIWSLKRRMETGTQVSVANTGTPVRNDAARPSEGRVATDSKAWPAA